MTGALSGLLAASKTTTSSSGSPTFIIFLVLIALVGYFLLIRPQKQKQRRQREQQQAVGVGDEILTVGGIVGRVVAVDADRITIVTGGDTVGFPAVGSEPTRLVLVRNAVARKVEPVVPGTSSDPDPGETTDGGAEHPGAANGAGFDGRLDGHDSGLDGNGNGNGTATEGAQSESEGTST